jgi:hypothetical protein
MENIKKNYTAEEVRIRVINDDAENKIYVIFSTLMETQFYSPGVKTTTDDKNNVYIEFMRAGIQDKNLQFDIKAEYLIPWLSSSKVSKSIKEQMSDQSTSAEQVIFLPNKHTGIYVSDGVNKKLVWNK